MSLRVVRRHASTTTALVLSLGLLAGCTGVQAESGDSGEGPSASASSGSPSATAEPASVTVDVGDRPRAVPVDQAVRVEVENGDLTTVKVRSPQGRLAGAMADGAWEATGRLEPGTQYRVRTVAVGEDGETERSTSTFRTVDLTLDEQTYASVAPLDGETVGVGMPVIVTFDIPVKDKAAFEKHMSVTSTPKQRGTWHWVNGTEVHWRPKQYWKAGSHVVVDVDVNSIPAGGGIYGQESRTVEFDVGDRVVSKVNVDRHVMKVFVNGSLARTVPISAGKPGWETRSGTKVIIEKYRSKRMDASTIGVSESDPEYYDLSNVQYAMRVTYSGEFIHGAPWSTGSQGSANVSHGCVGMSLTDAKWVYDRTTRGDVVEVTGSERQMTLYNGWGDWNADFQTYKQGSALS
jgi:lipoprotein-anchoring transpeptidase ErfK/SrfK